VSLKPPQAPATLQELREHFRFPRLEFGPCPTWWWSGDPIKPKRLQWQMERMAEGGIRQFVVLNLAPAGPLYGKEADDPLFFSERWWECFELCCRHAKTLGMRVWFYDQLGFSSASLQGRLCAKYPVCRGQSLHSRSLEGEGSATLSFPDGAELRMAFLMQPGEEPRELPVTGHIVRFCGSGRWRILLVYSRTEGFDYLSSEACALLRDTLYGEFERRVAQYLGSVIGGSFQDELPSLPTWSCSFESSFLNHAGYSILPSLWALFEGASEWAQKVRRDFQSVRLRLAEEAFFRPAFEWHEKHGMICGCDQQGYARCGYPVDTVHHYADYPRSHRWYGAPGADHHGEIRLHSSLASHYERKRVWFESFHSSGWGGTLEETFDWLLPWWVAGANLYNPHAIYYTTRGAWWEWAPPSTCWRQPYWKHYEKFSEAVARVSALLALGDHACDLAVLHPTTTAQAWHTLNGPLGPAREADQLYRQIVGEPAWHAPKVGVLDRLHLDFSILDDAAVQRAVVKDGELVIARLRYRTIILPGCNVLEERTAEVLAEFVEAGGTLLTVGSTPNTRALQAAFASGKAKAVSSLEDLETLLRETVVLNQIVSSPVPARQMHARDAGYAFIPLAYPGATKQDGNETWWEGTDYSFDSTRYKRGLAVSIRAAGVSVEVWDPVSGAVVEVEGVAAGDRTVVRLPQDVGPAVFLVWHNRREGSPRSIRRDWGWYPVAQISDWRASLEPTLDNRHGDFALPPHAGAPDLQTWELRYRRSGEGQDLDEWKACTYENVHATFGHQGWWRKAVDGEEVEWCECIYSASHGLRRDRIHEMSLGTSGHVPDEFIDGGAIRAGERMAFETFIWSESPAKAVLAIGAPGRKEALINQRGHSQRVDGFHWMEPVTLVTGWNRIEWSFEADEDTFARCYWTLLDPDAASTFRRPEFICVPRAFQSLRAGFRKEFELPFAAVHGRIMVFASCPGTVHLDGKECGRLGGFMPYSHKDVSIILEMPPLAAGTHVFEFVTEGDAGSGRILVDGWWEGGDGHRWELLSDATWIVPGAAGERAGASIRMGWGTHLLPGSTSRDVYLVRRPHPLPRAHWLERKAADGAAWDVRPDPLAGSETIEWFQWILPPQARSMKLMLAGTWTLWVNGQEVKDSDGIVRLPFCESKRVAVVRVSSTSGPRGAGVWEGPVIYPETSENASPLGDWNEMGLSAYSGGVRYAADLTIARLDGRPMRLDLGRVRGSVEVWVNQVHVGCRFVSPWVFDVTGRLCEGMNRIEVVVFNTLAPYFAANSPSHYIRRGQTISGLFGPVRLLLANEDDPGTLDG
jgi:hypothetical protein